MRILDFWREGPERGAKRRERGIAPARNELLHGGLRRCRETAGRPCTPSSRLEPAINSLFLANDFSGGTLSLSREVGRFRQLRERHVYGNSIFRSKNRSRESRILILPSLNRTNSIVIPRHLMTLELGSAGLPVGWYSICRAGAAHARMWELNPPRCQLCRDRCGLYSGLF